MEYRAALDGFAEGAVLWSESYHRDIDDLLDIQSEIALSVASAILPVLSPESRASLAAPPTKNPEAYDFYLRARDYMRRPPETSNIQSAERLIDRAIELDPGFAEAWAGRCNLLIGKYEFDRNQEAFQAAETACDRALTLDPDSWEVDLSLGNLFRVSGRYDRAVVRLEAGLEKHPNNVGLLLALARTYADQHRTEDAEREFRRAEALDGGSWLVQNEFGILLGQSGRKDEAIERFRKVIELTPDSGIGYDNLANTYLSKGSLVEAREAFAQSPSRSRWTYENLGLVNYFLGEFRAAAENHERALELAPDNFIEWGNLGDAYRFMPERGQDAREAYRRAIELCEQALTVNPDDLRAQARLSTYYVFTGRVDKAESLLLRLAEEGELPGTVHFFVARTKMQLGDLKAAYGHLRAAIDRGWSKPLVLRAPDLVRHAGDERFARIEQ